MSWLLAAPWIIVLADPVRSAWRGRRLIEWRGRSYRG